MNSQQVLLGGNLSCPVAVLILLIHSGDEQHFQRPVRGQAIKQIGLVAMLDDPVQFCSVLSHYDLDFTTFSLLRPLSGRQEQIRSVGHQSCVVNVQEVVDPITVPHRRQVTHRDGLAVSGRHDMVHSNNVCRVIVITAVQPNQVNGTVAILEAVVIPLGGNGDSYQILTLNDLDQISIITAGNLGSVDLV